MSSQETITLHLHPIHGKKLHKGGNVQLTHAQLHAALNGANHNAEIIMAKKHVTELLRAHRNGKGYRLMHEKIIGGRLFDFGEIGRRMYNTAKAVVSNPVVQRVARQIGHMAIGAADKFVEKKGFKSSPYAALAHRALESEDVRKELQEQVGNDIVEYAAKKSGYGGSLRKRPSKKTHRGGNLFDDFLNTMDPNKNGVSDAFSRGGPIEKALTGPVAKQVYKKLGGVALGAAGDLITGNPLGGVAVSVAGSHYLNPLIDKLGSGARRSKRFAKGSPEAKQHMARIRAMRSGGALMPAGGAVKKMHRPIAYEL
jgi:hypothetical protein